MRQINFNNSRETLTEDDKDQITALVTKGCRLKNTMRVRSILTYSALSLTHYGIFNRIIKENDQWRYIAGQDHTSEIKCIRELILKGE